MSPRIKTVKPSAAHVECRNAMVAAMRQHADRLTGPELVAVAAYSVGQLVALLDQRVYTSEAAMELVARNIEAGNQDAISELAQANGGSA